jgi:3',5'-cyclic AMP phosphodiesterase CpdA
MRIIHFSDVHAGRWLMHLGGYFDKRILGAINFCGRRRGHHDWSIVPRAVTQIRMLNPDVVICTGDLASMSQPWEFAEADRDLGPLVKDARFPFIYTPGNHDAYVDRKLSRDALSHSFHTLNEKRWEIDDLPQHLDIGPVRFLIVNEAVPTFPFAATGRLDDRSAAWIAQQLADSAVTSGARRLVLVGHWPLFTRTGAPLPFLRRCKNCDILQEGLRSGAISLTLCGHIHSAFDRREPNGGGLEICAGSLTSESAFCVIDYNVVENKIERRWIDVPEPNTTAPPPLELDTSIV